MAAGKQKPRGFRDILFAEAARRERLISDVSTYFAAAGYELVETPTLEYPETLIKGQSFTGGINTADNTNPLQETFRFVDVDGNLIALRSDVTGSLARVVATRFSLVEPPYRLRYVADVFREQESLRGSDRQLTQLGLECFGLSCELADREVLGLCLGGAQAAGIENIKLHLSDVAVLDALLDEEALDGRWKSAFYTAWRSGDFIRVKELATDGTICEKCCAALRELIALRGGIEVLDRAEELLQGSERGLKALANLRASYLAVSEQIATLDDCQELVVDFSLTPHFEYYSGLIFELYATATDGRARVIGSGGRYDRLMEQFGCKMPAAGFVYDLAALERIVALKQANTSTADDKPGDTGFTLQSISGIPPLRVAIPKGKLFDDCVDMLEQAGVTVPGLKNPGRSLRLTNEQYDIIIAKPTDVAIYVSRGAADIGVGGRDTLVEADFPLLQLIDLGFGGCEFVVAVPEDMNCTLDELSLRLGTIRVATKYPRLTQQFFDARGVQVEIVKLNGNIELAPLIGIADLVVDITQTGTTLRENNLRVVEHMLPSTARFVAQYSAARTDRRVTELAEKLEAICRDNCK